MNILSLFNGISGLHLSCDRAGLKVDNCYYSEIDKYANQVTQKNYPDDIALGDVTKWREWNIDWSSIDLVGAGFPCQSWSLAGQQLGDKDERGMLFWTTLEIIKHVLYFNPKAKFLMENVKMKKDFEEYITHHTTQALGYVEKTLINSALVSAQNRNRYYWTNFEVTQPRDKGILLKDILEQVGVGAAYNRKDGIGKELNKAYCLNASDWRGLNRNQTQTAVVLGGAIRGRYNEDGSTSQRLEVNNTGRTNTLTTVQKDNVVVYRPCERVKNGGVGHVATTTDIKGMDCIKRVYGQDGKAPTLTTMGGGHREPKVLVSDVTYRKLTPLECERLQTLPDFWTDCISNTQRYKSIGNGWTIDVIAHILGCV